MTDLREVFEMTTRHVEPDLDAWRDQEERQRGVQRSRRLGALVVGAALGIGIVIGVVLIAGDRTAPRTTTRPGADTDRGTDGPTGPMGAPGPIPGVDYLVDPVPRTDYLLDLDTGKMTPLPESIPGDGGEYAASPDGSRLAYTARGDEGKDQVFVANLDGTGIVQVTHGLENADSPAWSPDGSKITYIGWHDGGLSDVFVLDLATGGSTQLTFTTREPDPARPDWSEWRVFVPSFTPDGASIVYSASRSDADVIEDLIEGEHEVRIVPVSGGESVRLMSGSANDLNAVGDPVLSPDGSLLYGCFSNAALCVANADGTGERVLLEGQGDAIPTARWSPDGAWIAYWEFHQNDVSILDVATGAAWHVAEGSHPTWVDDDTLIVEMDPRCYDPATGARGGEGCKG